MSVKCFEWRPICLDIKFNKQEQSFRDWLFVKENHCNEYKCFQNLKDIVVSHTFKVITYQAKYANETTISGQSGGKYDIKNLVFVPDFIETNDDYVFEASSKTTENNILISMMLDLISYDIVKVRHDYVKKLDFVGNTPFTSDLRKHNGDPENPKYEWNYNKNYPIENPLLLFHLKGLKQILNYNYIKNV